MPTQLDFPIPIPKGPITIPGVPGGGLITIGISQLLSWISQAVSTVAQMVGPLADIDAKLGFLIGNDRDVVFNPLFVPDLLQGKDSFITQKISNPLSGGCLGIKERDAIDNQDYWVGMYSLIKNVGFWQLQAFRRVDEVRSPIFRIRPAGITESGDGYPAWSAVKPGELDDVTLSTFIEPDVVHLLAGLQGTLSVAPKMVIPSIALTGIIKEEVVGDPTTHGNLAEVIAAQEMETVTRLEQFRTGERAT